MTNGKRARYQAAITRHAISSGWLVTHLSLLSLRECRRLLESNDPVGLEAALDSLSSVGADACIGKILEKYCVANQIHVTKKQRKQLPMAAVERKPALDSFLSTYEWRRMRMQILKRDGAKCACCGATPATGAVMNVDHIKPRRLFPHLALDPLNLQVLCNECNHGKGNWDQTDWR